MGEAEAHERALTSLFMELKSGFRSVDREQDPDTAVRVLKELGGKMTECKRLIREFEKEARSDGMDANQVQRKKTDMVNQLNKMVAQKKKRTEELQTKADLLAKGGGAAAKGKAKKGAKGGGGEEEGGEGGDADGGNGDITAQMTSQQLMGRGRKDMTETDKSIARSARVVEDTIAIGQQTAAMLAEQTHQMEKIMNDLDEITFSMKKAQKLLRDITRSMATDKCILMFLMLIVGGIVTIVVLKVAKVKFVKGINISVPLPTKSPPPPMPPPAAPAGGRRMLHAPAPAGWGSGGEAWRAWDGAALGAAGGWPLQ